MKHCKIYCLIQWEFKRDNSPINTPKIRLRAIRRSTAASTSSILSSKLTKMPVSIAIDRQELINQGAMQTSRFFGNIRIEHFEKLIKYNCTHLLDAID